MITNNMYSLCIDKNNKLLTGKLYFASHLVINNVNFQRFSMNISSRESNYHLHLNHCLRANLLEYLSWSRQNCHYLIPCSSHSQFLCNVPTLNILRGGFEFDANSDRNFKATLYEKGSSVLRINYRHFKCFVLLK